MKYNKNYFIAIVLLLSCCTILFLNSCDLLNNLNDIIGISWSLVPTEITIVKGGTDSLDINVKQTADDFSGFSGYVNITCDSSTPPLSNVTFEFSPSENIIGQAVQTKGSIGKAVFSHQGDTRLVRLYIKINPASNIGSYTVFLRLWVSHDQIYRSSFRLNVVDTVGGFNLVLSPPVLTIPRGSIKSAKVTINRSQGFSEPIAFTEVLDPTIVSTFIPSSTVGDTSTLQITVPVTAQLGQHFLQVKGRSLGTNKEQFANLTVNVTQDTTGISVSPGYAVSFLNHPATATVTLNRASCTQPVTLNAIGIGGGTNVFSPNPLTGFNITSTLSLQSSVTNDYMQNLYRISGDLCNLSTNQTYFTVMDLPAETEGNFLLVPTQKNFNMIQGQNASFDINILRFANFSQSVAFTVSNVPGNDTVSFSPLSAAGDYCTLTYKAAPNSSGGEIEIVGTAGTSISRFKVLVRVLSNNSSFVNIVPQRIIQVQRGYFSDNTLTIQRNLVSNSINLRVVTSLTDITSSFSDPSPTGNQSVLRVNVAQSLPLGKYIILLDGNDLSHFPSASFILDVQQ